MGFYVAQVEVFKPVTVKNNSDTLRNDLFFRLCYCGENDEIQKVASRESDLREATANQREIERTAAALCPCSLPNMMKGNPHHRDVGGCHTVRHVGVGERKCEIAVLLGVDHRSSTNLEFLCFAFGAGNDFMRLVSELFINLVVKRLGVTAKALVQE